MFLDSLILLANSSSTILNDAVREGKLNDAKIKIEMMADKAARDVVASKVFDVVGASFGIIAIFVILIVLVFVLIMMLKR